MTTYEIRKRIKGIKQVGIDRGDDETAHVLEDELHIDFINFIAESASEDLKTKAKIILTTGKLKFSRWCA